MSSDVTSTKTKRTGCCSEKLFLKTLNEEFNLLLQLVIAN
jgi:hypothetical protein